MDQKKNIVTTNPHDPFQTGTDTVRLNAAMNKIFRFPEVREIQRQIQKNTNGKRGVAIMVSDEFNADTAWYSFKVGDNSHYDRYMNIYTFVMEKKTGTIKVYEPVSDSIMTLKNWRKLKY